jgi:hypothetical protein
MSKSKNRRVLIAAWVCISCAFVLGIASTVVAGITTACREKHSSVLSFRAFLIANGSFTIAISMTCAVLRLATPSLVATNAYYYAFVTSLWLKAAWLVLGCISFHYNMARTNYRRCDILFDGGIATLVVECTFCFTLCLLYTQKALQFTNKFTATSKPLSKQVQPAEKSTG